MNYSSSLLSTRMIYVTTRTWNSCHHSAPLHSSKSGHVESFIWFHLFRWGDCRFYFIPTDRQRRCFSTGCSISRMRRSSNYTKKVTCDTWVTRESLYIPESPEVLFLLFSRGSVLAGHTNIVCCKRYHISLSQVAL